LADFIQNQFSPQIFEKFSKIKFNKNPFVGNRVVPSGQVDRRTDGQPNITKVTVTSRDFVMRLRDMEYFVFKTILQEFWFTPY
jgi:hypothetical protein